MADPTDVPTSLRVACFDLLTSIEWSGGTVSGESCCPSCSAYPSEGHREGCDLAELIKRLTEAAEAAPAFEIIHSGRIFDAGDVSEIAIDEPDSLVGEGRCSVLAEDFKRRA